MSHTFKVSDNEPNEWFKNNRREMVPFAEHPGIQKKLDGETVYASPTKTVGGLSPFFNAFSYAFNNHCPLVITPDSVWLTVLTGLCHHIDTDPEGLRHHFVRHEGKKELKVRVGGGGFAEGNVPGSTWGLGISRFAEQIKEHIGKKHDLIVCDFSTTTEEDKVSSMVSLMGAMKHYFEYKMYLACGLSAVTIEGTPEDWANIGDRIYALSEFDLKWWTDHLTPVIDQLKLACEGKPDIEFWKAGYLAHRKGSGGQYDVSGWINTLFPYIAGKDPKQLRRNEFVDWQKDRGNYAGVDPDDFPFGMSYAPVELDDNGIVYDCKFYGGLVGVSMAEDFTVKAESGIAIQNLGLK